MSVGGSFGCRGWTRTKTCRRNVSLGTSAIVARARSGPRTLGILLYWLLSLLVGYQLGGMGPTAAFFTASAPVANNVLGTAGQFAPTGLAASSTCQPGSNGVALSWNAPAGGWAATYRVFRSTTSGGENLSSPLATVATTSYTDTDPTLISGNPYYYEVQAVTATGVTGTWAVSNEAAILFNCTLQVQSIVPGFGQTNVSVSTRVAVTFNTTMASSQPANALTLEPCTDSTCGTVGTAVPGTISVSGSTVYFTPGGNLTANTWYLVTATTALVGSSGQTLPSNYTSTFQTGSSSSVNPPTVVPPTVPASGATGVAINTSITVTFSTTMAQAATQSAFSLQQTSGTGAPCYVVGGSPLCGSNGGSFSWSGASINVMTFRPAQYLAASAGYTVVISSAATDIFGNPMTAPYSFSFTTAAAPDTTAPNPPTITNPTTAIWSANSSYTIQGTVSSIQTESSYTVRVYNDNANCATYKSGDSVSGLTVAASVTLTGGLTTFAISTPLAIGTSNCFLVTATDEAGNQSASTAVPIIHQGNTETMMGTLVLSSSFNSISVELTYSDDANRNNSATVAWCQGTNCTNFGPAQPMSGGGAAGSPFTYTISGLTRLTTYTVKVTVSDPDTVVGTNPVTGTATTLKATSGLAGGSFPSRAPASGTITIIGPSNESADVVVETSPARDLGCQTLSPGGVNFAWTGVDGNGSYVPDGSYPYTATSFKGKTCSAASLGSTSGRIVVSNAWSISLVPPPGSVTITPGQSVTITATAYDTNSQLIPDGTPLSWSAIGSITGPMNSNLSATSGTIGSGSGGCTVSPNTGQACVVLSLPPGTKTVQTITVSASINSQTLGTTTPIVVTGQTTINDPPAPPQNLQLSLGSLILRWQAPTDPRVAGYQIAIGKAPGEYDVVVDVGKSTVYEYRDVQPGVRYYVAVRSYNAVGILSAPATGSLLVPGVSPTPTTPATPTRIPATPAGTAPTSPTPTTTPGAVPSTPPSATATPDPVPSGLATPTVAPTVSETPSPTPTTPATPTRIPATPAGTAPTSPTPTTTPGAVPSTPPSATATPDPVPSGLATPTVAPTVSETPSPTPATATRIPATPAGTAPTSPTPHPRPSPTSAPTASAP